MGNRDRAADDERHVEGVKKLFSIDANLRALFDVIGDAVVTTQHGGRDEAHQLFGSLVERAVFVSLRVESEKTFDSEMITAQQFLVHRGAITVKLVHSKFPFIGGEQPL